MIRDKIKNENKIVSKKFMCAMCVFLFALFESVLLCGCASARDEVTMTLGNEYTAAQESDDGDRSSNNMTEESFLDEATSSVSISTVENGQPQVYIYVCGAVELPGVYSLKQGSRLYEAVELAGGLTADADENCLNMARQIVDGEQVVILTQEEAMAMKEAGTYTALSGEATQETAAQDSGLVNINTATVSELTTVSGIGASRAQAIVDYREKNGRFGSIDDIKKVDGIKDGLFSKIKDKITI
ncbi:MAG: ComEA family DNA-binding protein [Lachnospiraceae bacterium]|nr:ComEA family DNA-binding protein [Lachnospiraceae bacterium]